MAKKLYIPLFVVVLLVGILLSIYLSWPSPPVNDNAVVYTTGSMGGQLTVEEVERQILELNKSLGETTGFGEGYDITFDPSAGTTTVSIPSILLFAPATVTLKKGSISILDHISAVLQQKYLGRSIDVVGHTDPDPIKGLPWKDNQEFSAQRASAVARYLIEHGISEGQTRVYGYGGANPRASNKTASGKALNRRVEILVYMRRKE